MGGSVSDSSIGSCCNNSPIFICVYLWLERCPIVVLDCHERVLFKGPSHFGLFFKLSIPSSHPLLVISVHSNSIKRSPVNEELVSLCMGMEICCKLHIFLYKHSR